MNALGSPSLALPLGELSPQVTERALSVLAALSHLSQGRGKCSPLALPLGELSPQVTERALAGIENIGDTPRKKCYTLEKVCKGKGVDGHV